MRKSMMILKPMMVKDINSKRDNDWCSIWRKIKHQIVFFWEILAEEFPCIKLENCESNSILNVFFLTDVLLLTNFMF